MTIRPDSRVAGFCTLLAVSPRRPSGGLDDFHDDRCGDLDFHRFAFGIEDFDSEVFDQIIFGPGKKGFVQFDGLVGLGVHKVVALMVLVAELERTALEVDEFDFLGRTEADIARLPGLDAADDGLDKGAEVAGGAVGDFEHNIRVGVVFDGHSFAEVVGSGHKVFGMRLRGRRSDALEAREVLRIDDTDRAVVFVHHDQIINAMGL